MSGTARAREAADPGTLRLLVFTDLDGTLLSHDGYDWRPAKPALEALKRLGGSLVIASSKTRSEIEIWRKRLGFADPFITENGGALWVPMSRAPGPMADAERVGSFMRVAFGAPYAGLRAVLREIQAELGVSLRGFGDMENEEIAALTGLPPEEAARAGTRAYDEPFVPERSLTAGEKKRLESLVEARGLTLTHGGRFFHLTGANDKGRAAQRLIDAWRERGRVRTIGLGDGRNDLEMLTVCDRAVIVARPDGSHAPELVSALPEAIRTARPGPEGFSDALLGLLEAPEA